MKFFIFLFSIPFLISCNKKHIDPNPPYITPTELSDPLFSNEFGNGYDYQSIKGDPLTLLSSGDILVSSIQENNTIDKLQITKITGSGSVIWQKNFTQGYNFKSGNCFEISTGEIIALGASIEQNSWTNSGVFISKLNAATGDTVWTRTYGNNYVDRGVIGYEDASHNYWIVDFWHSDGRAMLLKISANGDSLTCVFNSTVINAYKDAMITRTKDIVIVGETTDAVAQKNVVYICSYTNGNLNFSNTIALDNFNTLTVNDICETYDGNYVICGECYNFANTQLRNGFLIKVTPTGNKIWEKVIGGVNNNGIYACLEKSPDVFYISEGFSGNGALFKYDLSTATQISPPVSNSYSDIQLIKSGSKLYRASLDIKQGLFFGTIRLKAYQINQ